MPDATLNDLLTELRAIRLALETRPVAPPPVQRAATASTSLPAGDVVIPQPVTVIADAGDVQVHFGKNAGIPLKSLTERSLQWYAEEKPAKLKDDGTPYPLRPLDALLLNAARTFYHQTRGTLGGATAPAQQPSTQYMTPSKAATLPDAEAMDLIPF